MLNCRLLGSSWRTNQIPLCWCHKFRHPGVISIAACGQNPPQKKRRRAMVFFFQFQAAMIFYFVLGKGMCKTCLIVQRYNLVVVYCQDNIGLCTWRCPACGRNRASDTKHGTELPKNSFGGRLSHGKSPLL